MTVSIIDRYQFDFSTLVIPLQRLSKLPRQKWHRMHELYDFLSQLFFRVLNWKFRIDF